VGCVIGLDGFLDRVLHSASYRQAFLDGRTSELGLSEADLEAVRNLDRGQLQETAEAVRSAVLERQHRGSGGLRVMYPQTLAAWRARTGDEDLSRLLDGFMESPAFEQYREIPFAGDGICLEEAFFRFAEAEDIGEPGVREAEFLAGLMKALALSPNPAFVVGPPVRRAPKGWFAVSTRGRPTLFAAVAGRFVQGGLTPFLADLLTGDGDPGEVARKHGVDDAVGKAAVETFTKLGLL
jgi:hypothetical protein